LPISFASRGRQPGPESGVVRTSDVDLDDGSASPGRCVPTRTTVKG
jgi:hypothetical protein